MGKKYIDFYDKFAALRPKNTPHDRVFVQYIHQKCTRSPVGINTIGKIPSEIANFLNLPDPHLYTGHCFRRSSATLLANSGASLTTIKSLGGWKSSKVAEGYIENSISNKISIARNVLSDETEEIATLIEQPSASRSGDIELMDTNSNGSIPTVMNNEVDIAIEMTDPEVLDESSSGSNQTNIPPIQMFHNNTTSVLNGFNSNDTSPGSVYFNNLKNCSFNITYNYK